MFSHPSICSAQRLRFTLAKLQCLQSSSSINYRNYSQLRSRVTCMITASHSKVVDSFRTSGDAFGIASHLKPLGVANIINRGYLRPNFAFSKTFVSQAPLLTNELNNELKKMLVTKFGDAALSDLSRRCPSCNEGTLIYKVSQHDGSHLIACDARPQCRYIAKILYSNGENGNPLENKGTQLDEPKFLGFSPSGLKVFLKGGPYGSYVQLGEDTKGDSPKRTALGNIKEDSVTLEVALELLRYPLTLGIDPTDGEPVMLILSMDGVTIRKGGAHALAPKDKKPDEITMEDALKHMSFFFRITAPKIKPSFPKKCLPKHQLDNGEKDDPLKNKRTKLDGSKFLGSSPSGLKVFLKRGPYGSYVQLGEDTKGDSPKRMALGNIKEDSVTLKVALELLRYPLTLEQKFGDAALPDLSK